MTNATTNLIKESLELAAVALLLRKELAEAQSLNVELCESIIAKAKYNAALHARDQKGITSKANYIEWAEQNYSLFIPGNQRKALKRANYPLT